MSRTVRTLSGGLVKVALSYVLSPRFTVAFVFLSSIPEISRRHKSLNFYSDALN